MLRKLALLVAVATIGLASPANAATPHTAATSSCTKTSSGSCIRGGQLCPRSKYGQSGYDSAGHRYVCKGSHTHPHWMVP